MLTITLLGTAATMPLPDRALSTAFAACGGHGLLFDCGEGTQAAARRAGVNLMRADAVCLTHYHGDHIFGLPGLLQTLGCQGRTRPLALYGPAGLDAICPALRTLTGLLVPAILLALMTHISLHSRQESLQRALAIYTTSTMFGAFLCRIGSGFITSWLGWQAAFLTYALLLGSALPCHLLLQRTTSTQQAVFSPAQL